MEAASAIASDRTPRALLEIRREVMRLAARDRAVRAHEQAHAAVGGPYAGHPQYEFVRGPNGVRYATAGQVKIDISEVPGDPAATLRKMRTVSRAALAPTQPSAADRAVAAKASVRAARALAELAAERTAELDIVVGEARSEVGSTRGGHLDVRV